MMLDANSSFPSMQNVLIAGSYFTSPFLGRRVEECVARLSGTRGEIKVIKSPNPESVLAQGALNYAWSLRME